jgi:hypothetical protein
MSGVYLIITNYLNLLGLEYMYFIIDFFDRCESRN